MLAQDSHEDFIDIRRVSVGTHPVTAIQTTVQSLGKPIRYSTNVGFNCPLVPEW